MMADKCKICVVGLLDENSINFQIATSIAKDLQDSQPEFYDVTITGLLEFDWNLFLEKKKREIRGETWAYEDDVMVFINDELVNKQGGAREFEAWAETEANWNNFRSETLYKALAEESYKAHLNSKNHDYVFMDISIGDTEPQRLTIEVACVLKRILRFHVWSPDIKLFSDELPKTCENFRSLCTGEKGESLNTEYSLHYLNSIFHRVVPNGWVQGGDIWLKQGDGGESVHGLMFEDENFSISHDSRGIVGMANKGRHTNGSQFYVTLNPAPWMDKRYVAFGRVIQGTRILKAMEVQETINERPLKEIRIVNCGVLTFEF